MYDRAFTPSSEVIRAARPRLLECYRDCRDEFKEHENQKLRQCFRIVKFDLARDENVTSLQELACRIGYKDRNILNRIWNEGLAKSKPLHPKVIDRIFNNLAVEFGLPAEKHAPNMLERGEIKRRFIMAKLGRILSEVRNQQNGHFGSILQGVDLMTGVDTLLSTVGVVEIPRRNDEFNEKVQILSEQHSLPEELIVIALDWQEFRQSRSGHVAQLRRKARLNAKVSHEFELHSTFLRSVIDLWNRRVQSGPPILDAAQLAKKISRDVNVARAGEVNSLFEAHDLFRLIDSRGNRKLNLGRVLYWSPKMRQLIHPLIKHKSRIYPEWELTNV